MSSKTVFALLLCLFILSGTAAAKEFPYHLDEIYPVAADGILFLDTDDAEVTIIGSDRSDVHVVVDHTWYITGVSTSGGDDFAMTVTEENGNLRIEEAPTEGVQIMMGSIREDYQVRIEAPSTVSLRLEGDDDDYDIRGFSGNVRMDFEDGDAHLREMTGQHFEFTYDDGTVDLNGGSGLLDVYFEDGTFICENGSFNDLSAVAEDGELLVMTSLADEGSYRMRCDDGEIELVISEGGGRFRLDFDDGHARVGNEFEVVEEDDHYEEYTLPGGNADVRISVEDGRVILDKK